MDFTPSSTPGIIHHYYKKLVAFEHLQNPTAKPPPNSLIFVGGLSDGLLTVPYTGEIVKALPDNWSFIEILITSSYLGWGIGSLERDAAEIAQLVRYIRSLRPGGKIVLMGHSTGCQDSVHYVARPYLPKPRPTLDGVILQAGASDREAIELVLPAETVSASIALAREMMQGGKGEDLLPWDMTGKFFDAPCTARRWLSLTSPEHDGDDDYFSSDLSDEQIASTFGKFPATTPLCILYSGADQYVPASVDKEALIARWVAAVKKNGGVVDEQLSGTIPRATHNLNGDMEETVANLVGRVVSFVRKVEAGFN